MPASIAEIKRYFKYDKNSDFMKDWKELSDEDKQYFKDEVPGESA